LILFTHIPLYRSPDSSCGPLREKGVIPAVRGEGYQTLFTPETSQLLLNELHPTLIFRYLNPPFSPTTFVLLTNTDSGDDHDYCEYIHSSHERRIPEVTIKSLSMAMGIRQPGFQLLSLSSEARTNAHQSCLLPDQLRIYCWVYAPLVLATIVLVALRALITAPSRSHTHTPKLSRDLLPYRASRPVPPRKRSYLLRVAEDIWAVTWPPLVVYMVTALMAFW
jgi:hypothetical protein